MAVNIEVVEAADALINIPEVFVVGFFFIASVKKCFRQIRVLAVAEM